MAKNEDGEYELILGNRQLLSIFFVVVVLLGAGFTLGYIMGRETGVPSTSALQKVEEKAELPLDLPPALRATEEPPPVPTPAPVASEASTKPSASPEEKPHEKRAGKLAYQTGNPPSGSTFLQVAAVSQKDAEMQASGLAAKGFPMWVAPNETSADLFSVMVGPFEDRADLAKAKASLDELGYRKTFRKEIK